MPDLVHDPGGAHLKPRYRTLLGLGLAATVALTLPAFLYAALALARVLGIDAHAPLWRQRRSDLGFFLVIVTAMIWIAACFVVYRAILVAVLRRKGVLTPDVGWFSALGSRFPAPWLDNERRQSGSLWTPWGWERVRLGPQFATALVFFGFIVGFWLLADAGQALIDRWNDADGKLPVPAIVVVLIAIVAIGLAMWWASVVVVALASLARGTLRRDEALGLVVHGRCPDSWKAKVSD